MPSTATRRREPPRDEKEKAPHYETKVVTSDTRSKWIARIEVSADPGLSTAEPKAVEIEVRSVAELLRKLEKSAEEKAKG